MANQLQYKLEREGDTTRVIFSGVINGSASLTALASQLSGNIVFDTFAVSRIDSLGVREWLNFITRLTNVDKITLVRCSPAIVTQLNNVDNFRGEASVESVAAPFYCNDCDAEHLEIIDTCANIETPVELIDRNEHHCRQCGAAAEFDDLVERYFQFLAGRQRNRPPPIPVAMQA